jgi:hypothetical protein
MSLGLILVILLIIFLAGGFSGRLAILYLTNLSQSVV